MTWYERARAALRARGLTYQDVADALHADVSQGAVGHKLRGRSSTSVEEFAVISELCEVSASRLLGQPVVTAMNPDERNALLIFRRLNDEQKARLVQTAMDLLAEQDDETTEK